MEQNLGSSRGTELGIQDEADNASKGRDDDREGGIPFELAESAVMTTIG